MPKENEGLKFDAQKPRYDLLPFDALDGIAQVLTFGAAKYAPNSWQKVENGRERYLAALLRHVSALAQGHLVDEESGLPVVDHIATNALFLGHLYREKDITDPYEVWEVYDRTSKKSAGRFAKEDTAKSRQFELQMQYVGSDFEVRKVTL